MDSYSYAAISSSSSSIPYPQEVKKNKPLPSYHSSLHGVRRLPSKPMTKQPIAPLPPTPPKIYRVEPVNFKEVVQMLTAAPEFQSSSDSSSGSGFSFGSSSSSSSRRLQAVAPPPLDLSPVSLPRNNNIAAEWREFLRPSNNQVESISGDCNDSKNEAQEIKSHITSRIPSENYFGSCSPLTNFPLSPASFAWCCSLLLSPSTLTSPRPVL
ncbi:uncharacterized protein [Nicotiana tomentosiformis]|uniref:uncharacterized protein n=1 Tax=Nicotiana tomentosiformis TaxID=4098 RepID=UPI00051C8148